MFVTGEYGEQNKRPHWHAIVFNWEPRDGKPKYKTTQGHQVYESETLTSLWGHGIAEYGSVTIDSAGYCARYAAKKLVHGKDQDHDFQPISKKSSKHAIGKKWLEKFWPDVFTHGKLEIKGKPDSAIPRYYEKWLKQNHPLEWTRYVTQTKTKIIEDASTTANRQLEEWQAMVNNRHYTRRWNVLTKAQVRKIILDQKFNLLQNYLKL